MKILAFNTTHDSSVAFYVDGRLEFFCKEERVTRKKRDKQPFKSLSLFRDYYKGKIDRCLYLTPSNINTDFGTYYDYIRKIFDVELENYSSLTHHICHAGLAFFNSEFKQALVIVVDRHGSIFFSNSTPLARECESVFVADIDRSLMPIKPIYKNFSLIQSDDKKVQIETQIRNFYGQDCDCYARSAFSIITAYESATTLIGNDPLENGKTMGLSSYCEKEEFDPLFVNGFADSSKFFSNANAVIPGYQHDSACFVDEYQNFTTEVTKDNFSYYAEKAKHVQVETQKAMLDLIKKYIKLTGIRNVCVVGGYGLNVVANNYYLKNLPDVNFYFEPVADDTGVSIGAAMLETIQATGIIPESLNDNFYHFYADAESIDVGKDSSIEEICNLLIDQKSIGLFEGRPEAGPRALGHRSILFDPRNKDAKDIINSIKKREWYRPFAGIILKSEFKNYFDTLGLDESKYMTINFDAYDQTVQLVPGIIHVDNTCRIQTVSEGTIFEILSLFYKKTGCPMLLNTSLNLAGDPLVHTKQDALHTLEQSTLDYLYFVDNKKLVKNTKND